MTLLQLRSVAVAICLVIFILIFVILCVLTTYNSCWCFVVSDIITVAQCCCCHLFSDIHIDVCSCVFFVHWQLTTVVDVAVLPAFVSVRCVTPRSGGVFCCPTEVVRKSTVRKVLSVVGVSVGSLRVPPLAREQTVRYWFCSLVTSGPTIVKTVVVWNISNSTNIHTLYLSTQEKKLFGLRFHNNS